MDGDGSLWDNSDGVLSVGDAGDGTLSITGGGQRVAALPTAAMSATVIGSQAGSTGLVTVDGDGSLWESSGGIIVGDEGDGTLEITAGGIVQNIDGRVGGESTGTGHVTVDGDGSLWDNSGSLLSATEETGHWRSPRWLGGKHERPLSPAVGGSTGDGHGGRRQFRLGR